MIVAFSGNDGSGKTTYAKKLIDSLSQSDTIDKESIRYLPEEKFFFIGTLRDLFSKNSDNNTAKLENSSKLSLYIFAITIFLDQYLESLFYKYFRRKTIVIKDRSIIDRMATFKYLGLKGAIFEFLFNRIQYDLHFYIDQEIDILKSRVQNRKSQSKRTYPEDFFEKKEAIYKDIIKNKKVIIKKQHDQKNILEIVRLYSNLKRHKFINLSGMDGTGKSTQIKNLSNTLKELSIGHSHYHFYYNYLILKIIRSVRGKSKQNTTNQISQEKVQKSKIWMTFVLVDALLQYYLARIINFNKIIVFDRSFVDYLISFKYIGLIDNIQDYINMIPKTGYFIFLSVSPEVAYNRKPEHSIQFFEETNSLYTQTVKELPKNYLHIDTSSKNADICTKEIINFLSK